jgi:hypothetical protein
MKKLVFLCALLTAAPVLAKVSPEEAAKLGNDLTEVGAERAANKDGTIPEFIGRPALTDAQIKMKRADLESLRKRLVKDIEKLIGDTKVVADILSFGQDIMDAEPAKFARVLDISRSMLAADPALKAEMDKVLAGRGGKSVDGLLAQVGQKQVKLVDLTEDIAAVITSIKSKPDGFTRLVRAFDVSKALELASLVDKPVKGRTGADLIVGYMPPYVRDFLAFKVPGKSTADLLKPLYIVAHQNLAEYEQFLTEGQKAMFKAYPTYKMQVYPPVRAAFFPDEILKATVANASRGSLKGTDDLDGVELGFPFPIPKSGAEPMWNHKLKFRGSAVQRYNNQAIVRPDGGYKISKLIEDVKFKYANLKEPGSAAKNAVLALYLQEVLSPPRVAGQITLVHESADEGEGARKAWLYSPGLGRVNRAPDVGYDNPAIGSDGEQFYDQVDVFNGALNRYNWKLIGKKEILIPYNSWVINSPTFKYKDIIRPGHINQDLARYELHRVWVVEATLKPGLRHRFARRVFYLDEDSWSIALVDCYDQRGLLWKMQEAHLLSAPFVPTTTGIPELIYDLQSKRYFATALTNEEAISDFEISFDDKRFTPASLQRKARTQ